MTDPLPAAAPSAVTPPAVTPDDVRHVAKLARLAVPEAALPAMADKLGSILGYIAQINEVDVAGVAPVAHDVPLAKVLRADEPEPGLPVELALRNAPATDGSFFKVPKVLAGHDEDSAG
ncbi:MAG: gatC [Phycisphaerales bacterium]|nr:gatC [Phycisphaerales bacterium]